MEPFEETVISYNIISWAFSSPQVIRVVTSKRQKNTFSIMKMRKTLPC